ncbi:MAG: efflux RND transporter periplasmic adaptor subunit [Spirochaetales bacterium]|uniref:Efflux RND transporter periplasmic adaptor subunit n=1 Tax=Candidatus Thalassospirochaeta sargassi TaxID=3119039 RepID=A0AAJ1MKL1_9SPIO|nr:efflux RND transporter periplasmic adaptor subunit [Spirochaetales bacterium]
MNRKKIIIFAVVLAVIAAIVTVSIISKNRQRPMEVSAVDVILQDFIREVTANGDINSREYTRIFAAVSASVDEVTAEEGELIEKDSIIIRLNRESLENNLINAENAVINARMIVRSELLNLRGAYSSALAGWAQTEREWERTSELHKIGSVSDEELKLVEEQLIIAEETLESARQKLNFREGRELDDNRINNFKTDDEIVESSPEVKKALSDYDISLKNLKYYEIKTDSGGTLTALNVDKNSVVEPGMLMAEIHDEQQLIVEAMIDEVDLSYIKTGQEVKIISDSFLGTEIAGRVSKIAPIIRKVGDSRVCEIEVDLLENPDGAARIGASASIFIIVDKRLQQPAIPVEAYFIEENEKYIFVLIPLEDEDPENPGYFKVEKRRIETGILDIENIEVTDGLAAGELILSGRVPGVEDGMEVMLADEKNKKNKNEDK